jgi:hypothetical protein
MADAATAPDSSYLDTLTARAAQTLKDGSGDQSGNVLDLVKRIKSLDIAEDSDPTLQRMRKKIATDQEQVDKKADGVQPADVKPWDAKKEMADRQTDPLQAFGSFGSIFGILASAFTHQPMENALNASAAAIGAIHKGDEEAYKTAYDAWKENTNLAIERHKEQHEAFTDAMGKIESDASAMRTYAAKYGDQRAQILAESGLYQNLASMGNARQSAALQIMQAAPELEKKDMAIKAAFDLQAARKSGDPEALKKASENIRDLQSAGIIPATAGVRPPTTPFGMAVQAENGRRAEAGLPLMNAKELESMKADFDNASKPALSDDAAGLVADMFLGGNRQAVVGYGRSPANQTKIQNAIAEKAKALGLNGPMVNAMQAVFQGEMQGQRTLGARAANMEVAANEVNLMAPLALEASSKVDRTQYPALNDVILSAEKGTGGENVVQFGLAANSLIYTYAKFLNPTGIPTDADKARSAEILSTAWSKGQFSAAIDQIKREIASGQAAISSTKGEISNLVTGKTSHDNPATPASKDDYERLPSGAFYRMPNDPLGQVRQKP